MVHLNAPVSEKSSRVARCRLTVAGSPAAAARRTGPRAHLRQQLHEPKAGRRRRRCRVGECLIRYGVQQAAACSALAEHEMPHSDINVGRVKRLLFDEIDKR